MCIRDRSLSAEEVEAFFEPALNKVLESLGAKNYIKDLEDKLSDPEIPLLKNIMTTSWSSDPYARGAYSACKPGDDPMELVIALTAGQGNIRFAGEHTIMAVSYTHLDVYKRQGFHMTLDSRLQAHEQSLPEEGYFRV